VSGVSDAYQPAEAEKQLMPGVMREFIRHRNPLVIVTKSTLPLRDIHLITELAAIVQVDVIVSVSTLNEDIRRVIEPDAAETAGRIRMLSAFREAGCRTGILLMPVIPLLTDSEENLRGIFELARESRVNFILPGTLHLRGNTKSPFLELVRNRFPDAYPGISRIYAGSNADEEYRNNLRPLMRRLQAEYGPWVKYTPPPPLTLPEPDRQLSLF
jgi:DNA repair photolyase